MSRATCNVLGSRTTRFDDFSNTSLSSVSRVSFAGIRPNCALLLLPQASTVPPEKNAHLLYFIPFQSIKNRVINNDFNQSYFIMLLFFKNCRLRISSNN